MNHIQKYLHGSTEDLYLKFQAGDVPACLIKTFSGNEVSSDKKIDN